MRVKVIEGKSVKDVILERAKRGFHLLVIGASESDGTLSPVMDAVMRESPCATLLVKAPPEDAERAAVRKILVPTVGTNYSNHAVEMAALLAQSLGASMLIVHVVPEVENLLLVGERSQEGHRLFGEQIVDGQADIARHLGAEVATQVLQGNDPEQQILDLAAEQGSDLILMGTNLRPHMKRAFLGHRVEEILRKAPCAVVVLSSA